MKWRSHPGMAATVAARGRRGWYWITATTTGYQVLKAAGFDGLSIMIHTPHGTIEIPHAGKVCRDLATAKARDGRTRPTDLPRGRTVTDDGEPVLAQALLDVIRGSR